MMIEQQLALEWICDKNKKLQPVDRKSKKSNTELKNKENNK